MAKKNSIPLRVDTELAVLIRNMAKENDIKITKASEIIANEFKQLKFKGVKLNEEIKF